MEWVRVLMSRCAGFVRRRGLDDELDEELRAHIELATEENVRRGMAREEARAQALREFGGVTQIKEGYRMQRGLPLIEAIAQDVRYALRQIRKAPGFAIVAILSLALGIGATTSMFSLIYAVLLHPFPYQGADRIMNPEVIDNSKPDFYRWFALTKSQFQTLKKAKCIESLLGFFDFNMEITGGEFPEDVMAVYLTENANSFFGVRPLLGRQILPSDSGKPVVVLNYRFWQRHYDANPHILGRILQLDNKNYTIIGVMPRSFTFNDMTGIGDIYLPRSLLQDSVSPPIAYPWVPWIKLKPGISPAQADAELYPIVKQVAKETPTHFPKSFHLQLEPIVSRVQHKSGAAILLLFAAVLLLLFIGCANCSILLLARNTARQHELAVRSALGASRWRVTRQLLIESSVLSLLGSFLGIALSWWLAKLPQKLSPSSFPPESIVRLSFPVLAFAVGLALLTGTLIGLLPALRLSRPGLSQVLQSTLRRTGSTQHARSLRALIAGQVALTLILMALSGTAIGAFLKLMKTSLGYDPHHVMQVGVVFHWSNPHDWGTVHSQQDRAQTIEQIRQRIAAIPGVLSAAVGTDSTPPSSGTAADFEILGKPSGRERNARVLDASPQYFSTLHITLLAGRFWNQSEDLRGDSVAVINRAMAKLYFPDSNPIGQQIRIPTIVANSPLMAASPQSGGWRQIVGVVGDVRNDGLDSPVEPAIYVPYSTLMPPFAQFFVRTRGEPLASLNAVRAAVKSVIADQQISNGSYDLETALRKTPEWSRERLFTVLFGVFSSLALLLALVGLYSVVSYSVAQRTNEFGIRMALGAQRGHVLWIVMRGIGVTVMSGLGVGLMSYLALHKLLVHWMQNSYSNPLILAGAAVLFVVCSAIACTVPALNAVNIDPMQALRVE